MQDRNRNEEISDMRRRTHPIQDKAEVAIDFPEKFYMGTFSRGSTFEARGEDDGLFVRLTGTGDIKRTVEFHLHHHLMADILNEWAKSLKSQEPMSAQHRKTLLQALKAVEKALD